MVESSILCQFVCQFLESQKSLAPVRAVSRLAYFDNLSLYFFHIAGIDVSERTLLDSAFTE